MHNLQNFVHLNGLYGPTKEKVTIKKDKQKKKMREKEKNHIINYYYL